ncbi:DUF2953 domain-containing protein [Bacillus ginsengihumi]|uniref:DUF2953 domain-containing protein n=1 Tax=Heyndrickxia ginsengihumi TaxID=363870 RepID=A0A6M0P9S0_9BACI|nr:DUF2953 domain-containing protein [Bacillus sp. (in: firmicutes)]NEY21085.1 DUF2953 domain-containing protein [Heyndrickxia ginsengihumi]
MNMIWAISIVFILLFLIILLCISSLVITLDFAHQQDNDHFTIQVRLWRFIRHTIAIPMVKVEEDAPNIVFKKEGKGKGAETEAETTKKITPEKIETNIHRFKILLEKVFGLKIIIGDFIKSIQIKKLEWHTTIGLYDAATTGIVTGGIWAAKGGILKLILENLIVHTTPNISVTPSFQRPISEIHFVCMFQFQIGKAILTGLKIIKYWRGSKNPKKIQTLFKHEENQTG